MYCDSICCIFWIAFRQAKNIRFEIRCQNFSLEVHEVYSLQSQDQYTYFQETEVALHQLAGSLLEGCRRAAPRSLRVASLVCLSFDWSRYTSLKTHSDRTIFPLLMLQLIPSPWSGASYLGLANVCLSAYCFLSRGAMSLSKQSFFVFLIH